MNRKTKIVLAIVGISAVIIPAVLLVMFTGKSSEEPQVSSGTRQINTEAIENAVKKVEPKEPQFPSPSPASGSATQNKTGENSQSQPEGSSSAQ